MTSRDAVSSFLKTNEDALNMNFKCIRDNAPRVVLELPDAKRNYDNCISSASLSVDVLAGKKVQLQTYLDELYAKQTQTIDTVNSIDSGLGTLEKEVEDARVLNEVRKQQAAELQQKTVGNLHSSWMGLWKPLSDEFRVGLAIFSIGLLLVSFVIVAFLIHEGLISIPALPFFSTQSVFTR